MKPRRGRVVVLVLTAIIACAMSEPAEASWGPPAVVSAAGENSGHPAVAMNRAGLGVVTWRNEGNGRVSYVIRSPAGELSAPQSIPDSASNGPVSVAVSPAGAMAIGWLAGIPGTASEQPRVAYAPAGGTFGASVFLTEEEAGTQGEMAVTLRFDDADDLVAFWAFPTGPARYAVHPNGGDWLGQRVLASPGGYVFQPSFALAGDGEMVAAFTAFGHLYAAVGTVASGFGDAREIDAITSTTSEYLVVDSVAMNATGEAILAWGHEDFYGDIGRVEVARRAPGAEFETPETVEGATRAEARWIGAALSDGGEPTVATSTNDGRPTWVHTLRADGMWTTEALEAEGQQGGYNPEPQFAYDPGGQLFAVWRRYATFTEGAAFGAVRQPNAEFQPVADGAVSAPGLNVWTPALAVGGSQQALAAWQRGTYPNDWHIELAAWEAEPSQQPSPTDDGDATSSSPTPSLAAPLEPRGLARGTTSPPPGSRRQSARIALRARLRALEVTVASHLRHRDGKPIAFAAPQAGSLTITASARHRTVFRHRWRIRHAGRVQLRLPLTKQVRHRLDRVSLAGLRVTATFSSDP